MLLLAAAVPSLRAPPCIPIDVAPSVGRGLGAFAASAISAGALVCSYDGERITQREVQARYDSTAGGDYLFEVRKPSADRDGLYLDAERGAHASRFINHAEHGNLVPSPTSAAPDGGAEGIDFYALREINIGEELSFDYGVEYWAARAAGPTPDSDSRLLEIRLRRLARRVGPLLLGVQRSLPL